MLFPDGVFAPESTSDVRVQVALRWATDLPSEILGPGDLLVGVLQSNDSKLLEDFTRGLNPGTALADLRAALDSHPAGEAKPTGAARTRSSFTPAALTALAEFEAALGNHRGNLDRFALEVLTFELLTHLERSELELLAALDVDLVRFLLWRRVAGSLNVQPLLEQSLNAATQEGRAEHNGKVERDPVELLEDLVPVEDLTTLAREPGGNGSFPFDSEPQFEQLFEEMTRALHRRRRHLLLVGERGVCKDTILAELARRATGRALLSLGNRHFLRIDCRRLPPHDCPQRLAELLSRVGGQHRLVLILNGLPPLLRGQLGAANRAVFLARLDRLHCHLVVPVLPHDYQELFSDDPDLTDCFSRVDVEEPEPKVALKVVRCFAAGLAQEFQVTLDEEAVRQAVLLSDNYILNDQLPAKALKVLHQACEDLAYEREHEGNTRQEVIADDVIAVVAKKSGVPEATLRGMGDGADFEQSLGEFILGQDHAVREVATELGLIKAGMTDSGKPASVMLFQGQTGTGKTEMAKVIARLYSTSGRLRTYTLGNCVEPHSVSTIIGVPPGYVGHDRGGSLVNDLNADPYSVFLLDEADKAHPDVLQPFLNLFDQGWVADQRGVKAYGDRAIFILTTNVGQRMMADWVAEGKTPEEIRDKMKEVLAHLKHPKAERPVFSAEFLARIKRIIVFNSLGKEALEGITRKQFRELVESWSTKRSRTLAIPEELIAFVAARAHELNDKSRGKEGGRIVRKLIADWVEAPLQRAIGKQPQEYRDCGVVTLDFVPPSPVPEGATPAQPTVLVRFAMKCAA
jgi:ATP-dependent Clp protease ATP-binding subunit ClpA